MAKDLIADEFGDIDPEAAQRIKLDPYVDDGGTGGTRAQVDRFIGEKLTDGSFSGTITQVRQTEGNCEERGDGAGTDG